MIPVVPLPKEPEHAAMNDDAKDVSDKEAEEDIEGVQEDDDSTTWHDIALSIAAEFIAKLRHDIFNKLGYSTSAVSLRHW